MNEKSTEILDIELSYTGGSVQCASVFPGTTARRILHPVGESHLEMAFTDSVGERHERLVGAYFETHYQGELVIRIQPDNSIVVRQDIRVY